MTETILSIQYFVENGSYTSTLVLSGGYCGCFKYSKNGQTWMVDSGQEKSPFPIFISSSSPELEDIHVFAKEVDFSQGDKAILNWIKMSWLAAYYDSNQLRYDFFASGTDAIKTSHRKPSRYPQVNTIKGNLGVQGLRLLTYFHVDPEITEVFSIWKAIEKFIKERNLEDKVSTAYYLLNPDQKDHFTRKFIFYSLHL